MPSVIDAGVARFLPLGCFRRAVGLSFETYSLAKWKPCVGQSPRIIRIRRVAGLRADRDAQQTKEGCDCEQCFHIKKLQGNGIWSPNSNLDWQILPENWNGDKQIFGSTVDLYFSVPP